jgi:hypothetical protein
MNTIFKNNYYGLIQLIILLAVILLSSVHIKTVMAENQMPVGKFSNLSLDKNLPDDWEPLTFNKIDHYTQYNLFDDNDTSVIKAESQASASGLIRKIKIDPGKYPVIKWRWKITNIYKRGNVTQKTGDDCPARIYIAFEYNPDDVGFFEKVKFYAIKLIYGEYPPIAAINYIWASKAPIGTIVENPYTRRVKMIVVESGKKKLNFWMAEERNIYNDYITAFGKKPPIISGVAIMTDSDNTGESAVSYYGDIVFESKQ